MLVGMTGFAEAKGCKEDLSIFVRLNTLNSRFLDLNLCLPHLLLTFEEDIQHYLRDKLQRGRVNLHISLDRTERSVLYEPHLDETLLRSITELMDNISDVLMVEPSISFADLLNLEVVSFRERPESEGKLRGLLFEVLERAVDKLLGSRKREGKTIEVEIRQRIGKIKNYIKKIEEIYPEYMEQVRNSWQGRLKELCGEVPIEPSTIAKEASQMVLRRDFNEELQRIKMQISMMEETIEQSPPVGSKLLFTLQEAHREINTLASKALQRTISQAAILMKEECERIRELVHNVE